MTLINTVSTQEAQGQIAEIYQEIAKSFGQVPNAIQMFSVSPAMLAIQWRKISYYRAHPNLGLPLLAAIRMLVSQENACEYCIDFNAGLLINMAGLSPEQVRAMQSDPASAPFAEKDKAMLLFVLKATRAPKEVGESDVQHLRALGWTDADLFDAVLAGAFNQAADTVFNTFKIERDF